MQLKALDTWYHPNLDLFSGPCEGAESNLFISPITSVWDPHNSDERLARQHHRGTLPCDLNLVHTLCCSYTSTYCDYKYKVQTFISTRYSM
jgi:hypothetical protein